MAALGVTPEHVTLYHPPGQPRRRDGTVDLPYATAMLRHFIQMYPDATHVTMVAGRPRRPWIRRPGASLTGRETTGSPGGQALFSMARWYWAYDYPDRSNVLAVEANQLRATLGFPSASRLLRCPDQVCLDRIHQAAEAYRGPSDIGYRSVPVYFKVLEDDPAVLMHGVERRRTVPDAAHGHHRSSCTGRAPEAAVICGAIALPSFGTYPAPLTSADRLAQTLRSNVLVDPFATRPVTVQAVDSAARVLGRSTAHRPGRTLLSRGAGPARGHQRDHHVPGHPRRGGIVSDMARGDTGRHAAARPGGWASPAWASGVATASASPCASSSTSRERRPAAPRVQLASSGPAAPGATSPGQDRRPRRRPVERDAEPFGLMADPPVTSASTGVVAPASTTVSTLERCRPSEAGAPALGLPEQKLVKHVATLSGRLEGRDYDIAAGYLANASVRVWLERWAKGDPPRDDQDAQRQGRS